MIVPLMKTPGLRRSLTQTVCLFLALSMSFALAGCGSDITQVSTSVTISSLPSEDVVPSCTYDLTLEPIGQAQQGVLVLFERADTNLLYNDKAFRDEALSLHYAILWAHQCFAASFNDLQADASKGPGRMLFAALSQFAQSTQHPELETTGIILYGFSAAGVLSSTIANDYPDRLLGVIQYASGAVYTSLDDVNVTVTAKIPALILANAEDPTAGTSLSLRYFERGRLANAPWAYGVQNATQHCCNLSTKSVILPWIQAIAAANAPAAPLSSTRLVDAGTISHFACTPDGVADSSGEVDCRFTEASLGNTTSTASQESGWLPDQASGAAWLSWVTSAQTN